MDKSRDACNSQRLNPEMLSGETSERRWGKPQRSDPSLRGLHLTNPSCGSAIRKTGSSLILLVGKIYTLSWRADGVAVSCRDFDGVVPASSGPSASRGSIRVYIARAVRPQSSSDLVDFGGTGVDEGARQQKCCPPLFVANWLSMDMLTPLVGLGAAPRLTGRAFTIAAGPRAVEAGVGRVNGTCSAGSAYTVCAVPSP
jgi:hypothetical protein